MASTLIRRASRAGAGLVAAGLLLGMAGPAGAATSGELVPETPRDEGGSVGVRMQVSAKDTNGSYLVGLRALEVGETLVMDCWEASAYPSGSPVDAEGELTLAFEGGTSESGTEEDRLVAEHLITAEDLARGFIDATCEYDLQIPGQPRQTGVEERRVFFDMDTTAASSFELDAILHTTDFTETGQVGDEVEITLTFTNNETDTDRYFTGLVIDMAGSAWSSQDFGTLVPQDDATSPYFHTDFGKNTKIQPGESLSYTWTHTIGEYDNEDTLVWFEAVVGLADGRNARWAEQETEDNPNVQRFYLELPRKFEPIEDETPAPGGEDETPAPGDKDETPTPGDEDKTPKPTPKPEPSAPAKPSEDDLDPAKKDLIEAPETIVAGERFTVKVPADEGAKVEGFIFSDPLSLGTATVSSNNTVEFLLPGDFAAGPHTVAVYDADGELLGYQAVTVTAPAVGGDAVGSDDELALTGPEDTARMLVSAICVLLAGVGTVAISRMRRQFV